VHRREPRREGDLRVRAVDPGDVRIGREGDRSGAGHERAERHERTGVDVHAGRREHDVVHVVDVRVGDLGVQLPPAFVERVELRLGLREWTVAARTTFPRGIAIDLEQHGEGALVELVPDRRCLHRPTAERDHGRIRQTQRRKRVSLFLQTESRLAPLLEELGDRPAQLLLEVAVEIDERPAEALGDLRAERRLAGAHEAHERQVPA
jgi:hypothetical protein